MVKRLDVSPSFPVFLPDLQDNQLLAIVTYGEDWGESDIAPIIQLKSNSLKTRKKKMIVVTKAH